ncbi:MAG TPA: NAD-dependent epimerase/dehydratase family protein [Glaciihabitans sp.]|jgi:dTDP-L-rhamnose 4-epimerase|nr:NAD-dependent epimerase/dehydratase family protein [Glaciihabitans sp.]
MTNPTVLITGGAGFIGSRLANTLAASGHAVTLVDSLHPQVHNGGWPTGLADGVTTLPFDVTVPSQWDALFKMVRPDIVVHLAAETGTGQSLTEASRHGRVNVVGTTELLDGLSRVNHVPQRFVLASSRAIYGEGRWTTDDGLEFYANARGVQQLERGQWDPTAPNGSAGGVTPLAHRAGLVEPRPSNVYAATKLAQEHVLSSWASARGSDLSILRLQNVYGPGQSLTNPYTGIVSLFARLAREHKAIPVYEDGRIVRDFVFIDDVVSALAAACASTTPGTTTVDIGSGEAVTLAELAEEIAMQAGAPEPVVTVAYRLGDVRAAFADLTDAAYHLDYTPQVTPAEGVGHLLEWIGTQKV